jgi:hypothetical protein
VPYLAVATENLNVRLVASLSPRRPGFESRSGNLGFVVGKTAQGQEFSGYFYFPYDSFHRLIHTRHHPSLGTGAVCQIVADVPIELSLTLTQESLEICNIYCQSKPDISEVSLEYDFCFLSVSAAHLRLNVYPSNKAEQLNLCR